MASRVASIEDVKLPEEAEEVQEVNEPEVEEIYDSTKMDPDETLYDGGPTFREINAWKDQYGDVFVTDFMGRYYVWRTLNRFEYRNLVKKLEQAVAAGAMSQSEATMNNEEDIAELCIIHPEYSRLDSTKHLAGVASTISQQVMEASAFTATDVRQL